MNDLIGFIVALVAVQVSYTAKPSAAFAYHTLT